MKRLLYLIPLPIVLVLVNYTVDPANLFNEQYESKIAEYLSEGYNVTDIMNFNERVLQKLFIEKMHKCPTTIGLGASRIMEVSREHLKEENFINNGVSGATLEDELAIYYLYEKKGCEIKKVILAVEPYYLNDNHQQIRWKALENEYGTFLNELNNKNVPATSGGKNFYWQKAKELVSFSYFKASLMYLKNETNKNYKPTKNKINVGQTIMKDGSIYYDSLYRSASVEEVDSKAIKATTDNPIYSLGDFTQLSPHYQSVFSIFVEHLQKKNIEVEFLMSPYHPIMYEYLKKNKYYQIVFDAEKYYRDFAKEHNIRVVGSYDPSTYNFDHSWFFDGFHCNDKAMEIILNSDRSN